MHDLRVWLVSSLQRIFPLTPPPVRKRGVAVNERGSFQVAVRHDGESPLAVTVTASASPGLDVRIRRVGYVPVAHHSTGVPLETAELDGISGTFRAGCRIRCSTRPPFRRMRTVKKGEP